MNCAAKFVHSDCGGRQGKGQTQPKNGEIQYLHNCRASQIVDFFAKDLIVLHIWVSWNLEAHFSLDVPTEWSSRASFLGTWRCGFPACSWLMTEEGMDCFPIPQKSLHIQRLASFNGKPCIFQGKFSLEGEYFSLHPVPAVHLGL